LDQVMTTVLPRQAQRRVIHLRRRDRVAHAVSYARASMSGIWRKEQENSAARPIEYSIEALEAAERGIEFQEAVWEQMFGELGLEALTIWHEDVVSDGDAVVRAVADYLGVTIDPGSGVEVPPVEKQSEGDSLAWAERYASTRSS
jgi:LPS sulfotransferase NodH